MLMLDRHDPGDPAECRAMRDSRRRVAEALLGRPFAADTASRLLQEEAELAALDALLEEPQDTIRPDVAVASAMGTAAGVAAATAGATIHLALEERRGIRFETAGNAGMHGQRWCLAWSLACITGDTSARAWLAHERVIRACQRGPEQADPFWEALCRALAEIGEGGPAYAALADAAATTEPAAIRIAAPSYVSLTRRPLIALAALLREGVTSAEWSLAVYAALELHKAYYEGENRRAPLGLIAFEILALCRLAQARGVATTLQSPYLPLDWLVGDWPRVQLLVQHPEQDVADALEARWVVDLAGYPREGRTQSLDHGERGLLVRYAVPAGLGLPAAEFVFAEAKPVPNGPGLLALDPAQTLAIAHRFAARGPLPEALAALRRVAAAAPEADRAALDQLAAEWRTRPPQAPPAPPDLGAATDVATALVAAEAVKRGVRPLLDAWPGGDPAQLLPPLRPRDDDYARVFKGEAAEAARAAFVPLWEGLPPVRMPDRKQRELTIHVCPAGLMEDDNLLSRAFPAGYRGLAPLLVSHRVWLAWRFVVPGEVSGLSYDGLVWCDDHWAWFPRPYLALQKLVAG